MNTRTYSKTHNVLRMFNFMKHQKYCYNLALSRKFKKYFWYMSYKIEKNLRLLFMRKILSLGPPSRPKTLRSPTKWRNSKHDNAYLFDIVRVTIIWSHWFSTLIVAQFSKSTCNPEIVTRPNTFVFRGTTDSLFSIEWCTHTAFHNWNSIRRRDKATIIVRKDLLPHWSLTR